MKKATFLICTFLFTLTYIHAKTSNKFKSVKISYQTSFNNTIDSSHTTILEESKKMVRLSGLLTKQKVQNETNNKEDLPSINTYLNYSKKQIYQTTNIYGTKFYNVEHFKLNYKLTLLNDTKKILGFTCNKAQIILSSNTIDIWYTKELGIRGTIYPSVGVPDGLVLQIVINGQYAKTASKIEYGNKCLDLKPNLEGRKLALPDFMYKVQQSGVINVKVFNNEPIYFRNINNPSQLSKTEVMHFAKGSLILRQIDLPRDNKDYYIFAELAQHAEGDAYDRTGSVFIIPETKKQSFLDGLIKGTHSLPGYKDKYGHIYDGMVRTKDYLPPVELIRFYTPFGIRSFNGHKVAHYHWPDSIVYKMEVTDYASILKGKVWIGTWIGNYAHNGHRVSLNLKFYPERNNAHEKVIYPLFTTTNLLEEAGQEYPDSLFSKDSLKVSFNLKTNLKDAYIRYISTGHGGWGEGDEFTPKLNSIYLDNSLLMSYTPWREDCASNRDKNPASANFPNGLSSSDLSRSGWCPGTVSYPVFVHIGKIKAGQHSLKIAIPVGAPAGKNLSYWCVSGVLVGEKNG